MFLGAKKQEMGERAVHPFPLVGEISPNPIDNFFKLAAHLAALSFLLSVQNLQEDLAQKLPPLRSKQ